MNDNVIKIKRTELRELYKILTNYPTISKEQVQYEMHKMFGEETFRPKDVTERIKTFEDACKELGIEAGKWLQDKAELGFEPDVIAYMKLRIICAALNEGWEPKFVKGEYRYYPWFWLYTEQEIQDMDEEEKIDRHLIPTGDYRTGYAGFAYAHSDNAPSTTSANVGSRLCLKSGALAVYCGKQFIDIWADFSLIRRR